MFPMTLTFRAALEPPRAYTRATEHAAGQVIPWAFQVLPASVADRRQGRRRQRGESRAANTFRASAGSSGSRAPMISTVSPARVSLCTHSMTAPWSAA